ncbi:MBL fold metallo-hydrolase [Abyssisolibacter fermentans]|uniref:MBL fold metallo-hydrolase n=1 Tax=Abyssisolibacter fermentans TaxID=1766203 RepID=UPI00082A7C96|nr:MBL fold metallo-hydrolase [Abyssisolibacter fermentans]
MDWYEINRKDDDTFIIREPHHWEKTNIYYLIGTEYNLLIDSGTGIRKLKKLLKNIDNKEIRVVTTHVHWDHIGNHNEFEKIYVHENEYDWIKKGIPLTLEIIKKNLFRDVDLKYISSDEYKLFKTDKAYKIKEGYIFDLGNRKIEVIHTPGHSPGHIALFEKEKGDIYVGDIIYEGTLYCNYESTNPEDYYKSIKKLYNMRSAFKHVLCGHNTSVISIDILKDIMLLMDEIKRKNKLKHGSGIHKCNNVEIII